MISCFILLHFFVDLIINSKNNTYYLMHFILNMYICYETLDTMIQILFHQVDPLDEIQNVKPMEIITAFHLYHIIIFFKKLTLTDWIHHVVNVLVSYILVLQLFPVRMTNYVVFFICGLPGGIDYGLLFLTKINLMARCTEKKINTYLNQYLRVPGLVIGVGRMWDLYIKHVNVISTVEKVAALFIMFTIMMNALYFSKLVCENYGFTNGLQDKKKTR